MSLPIAVGFGSDNGYTNAGGGNETYGYFTAGLSLSYPLKFVPECLGEWSLHAGYSYFHLGEGTKEYGTFATGGNIRAGNDHEHLVTGGLTVEF